MTRLEQAEASQESAASLAFRQRETPRQQGGERFAVGEEGGSGIN